MSFETSFELLPLGVWKKAGDFSEDFDAIYPTLICLWTTKSIICQFYLHRQSRFGPILMFSRKAQGKILFLNIGMVKWWQWEPTWKYENLLSRFSFFEATLSRHLLSGSDNHWWKWKTPNRALSDFKIIGKLFYKWGEKINTSQNGSVMQYIGQLLIVLTFWLSKLQHFPARGHDCPPARLTGPIIFPLYQVERDPHDGWKSWKVASESRMDRYLR